MVDTGLSSEGSGPGGRGRSARKLVPALAAGAVVIVAIGGVALFRGGNPATPPDDPAAATTTTTAPAGVLSEPAGLRVARSSFAPDSRGAAGPVQLSRLGDGYLAISVEFTASLEDGEQVPASVVRVWRSDDGAEWAEVDESPPFGGGWPRFVLSTGAEAVVLVEANDEEGAGGTVIDAYTTTDGQAWVHHRLERPEFPELGPYQFVSLSLDAAAAGPAGVVVTGLSSLQVDVDAVARDALGLEPSEVFGWMTDGESVRIELADGTTRSMSYAELGITRPGDPVDRVAWVSPNARDWDLVQGVRLPVPDSDTAMAATPSGGFLAVGFGDLGPAMSTSPDGRAWTPVDLSPFGGVAEFLGVAGGDRHIVAVGRMRDGATAVWTSPDGVAWTRVADLPAGDGEVMVTALEIGPLGTVVALTEHPSLGEDVVEPPMVISKDGLELRFDFAAGRLVLIDEVSGELLVDEAVDFDAEEPPDFVTIDEANGQIIVNDPATGEALFSFGPEEQQQADDVAVLESVEIPAVERTASVWYLGGERWEAVALSEGSQATEFDVSDVVVGDGEILYSLLARMAPGLAPQIWRASPGD